MLIINISVNGNLVYVHEENSEPIITENVNNFLRDKTKSITEKQVWLNTDVIELIIKEKISDNRENSIIICGHKDLDYSMWIGFIHETFECDEDTTEYIHWWGPLDKREETFAPIIRHEQMYLSIHFDEGDGYTCTRLTRKNNNYVFATHGCKLTFPRDELNSLLIPAFTWLDDNELISSGPQY
jgi:hypothetical protein